MTGMMHKLPISAYTSQDWFDRERKEIFSKTWRYAGFVEDVAEPGSYTELHLAKRHIAQ